MSDPLTQLILIISITALLTILIKNITKIKRPKNALVKLCDYSFPSGHTSMSFALASFFTYFIFNLNIDLISKIMLVSVIISGAVAITFWRLQIRVHTPFQVFIGGLLGVLVAVLVIFI
ncbi:MAG: phosphatase PAP2 family protein [Candidatus Paceibacterota bacterium]